MRSKNVVNGTVLLLGPSLENHGGMAMSEKILLKNWKSNRYLIKHIVTHHDGNSLIKIFFFLSGLLQYLLNLVFNKVSVVYIYFSNGASFYRKSFFIFIAKLFKRKIVIHSRGGEFGAFYYDINKPILTKYIRLVLRLADAILVLGQKEKELFDEITGRNSQTNENSTTLPVLFASLTNYQQIICTVGRLEQKKGTYDLIEAIPRVLEKFPQVEFWLCGDGEVAKCRNIINSKGIEGNVKLLGWVDDNQREEIYLKSCVYVLPSYFEGMPRSVLEAMSYGLPVISTRINGIPDLVQDGITGILIEPGDINALANNIIFLLKDEKMRIRLGRAGRLSIMNNYNVDDKLSELENVFDVVNGQV